MIVTGHTPPRMAQAAGQAALLVLSLSSLSQAILLWVKLQVRPQLLACENGPANRRAIISYNCWQHLSAPLTGDNTAELIMAAIVGNGPVVAYMYAADSFFFYDGSGTASCLLIRYQVF